MDIRVISTGHEFHQVDTKIAQLLLELLPAAVERINSQPQCVTAPPASDGPRFYVGKHKINDKVMLFFRQGSEEQWYDGPADFAHHAFGKRQVPVAVIDEYRLALKQEIEANRARQAQREGRQ